LLFEINGLPGLRKNILQVNIVHDWISSDIRNPRFLTVSTYQGLHASFTDQGGKTDTESEEIENYKPFSGSENILSKLKQKRVKTLVFDEAHHLRNEWWKSLTYLKSNIKEPYVISLTATPPYDVSLQEWKNYQTLCGPIDAEISVPKLVQEKDLCPHQDYVFLNSLSQEENEQVKKFRRDVNIFLGNLERNSEFISLLQNHPCILNPEQNIEIILRNPAYFSSIAVFLNKVKNQIPIGFFKILGGSKWRIPDFSKEWAEILLGNVLYRDPFYFTNYRYFLVNLERELKKRGAIEKRNVFLRDNSQIKRLLKESLNKLNSILEIVKLEHKSLGKKLRMVILTDFIRSEYFPDKEAPENKLSRIGVVPIFEKIRRGYSGTNKIGILSGSIVVIPKTARETLKRVAKELAIPAINIKTTKLSHDENYLKVEIRGENNQKIVHLITEVFSCGEIEILVGTKSLLGEGWDAPSVNTLVLASFVGSFMLSNQMRGRAIRADESCPDKISNIWHLVSVEKNSLYPGHDFETLKRRFKAFVGISIDENVIENGFKRMNIGMPPFSEIDINKINLKIKGLVVNRRAVKEKWERILKNGEVKNIIPEIKTEKKLLPGNFVFYNTIFALFWRSLLAGGYFFLEFLQKLSGSMRYRRYENLNVILWFIGIVFLISLVISLPGLLRVFLLLLRNGPVAGSIKQIGNALIKTLCKIDVIKTDVNKLRVITEKNKYGIIFCGLEGSTSYERSIFLDCLEDIVNPVENPRYILIRKSRLKFLLREDFHTVPQIIGTHKKAAEFFSLMWRKYVGDNKLIYTRNIDGRKLLLKARQKAMSTSFQKRSERINIWK